MSPIPLLKNKKIIDWDISVFNSSKIVSENGKWQSSGSYKVGWISPRYIALSDAHDATENKVLRFINFQLVSYELFWEWLTDWFLAVWIKLYFINRTHVPW